eukprot:GGOE01021019.1.p1 GENE.GGOE01021019.1~~GGOE01021019.1.p1  ORF type:complete len:185 (-),score=45.29 GGOE01021019.1:557-1111(-)
MHPIQSALSLLVVSDISVPKPDSSIIFTSTDCNSNTMLHEIRARSDAKHLEVFDAIQKTLLMTVSRSGLHEWYAVDGMGKSYVTIHKVVHLHGSFEIYFGDVKLHHITHHPEPKTAPTLTLEQAHLQPPEGLIRDHQGQVHATFKSEKQHAEPHCPLHLEIAAGGVPSLCFLLVTLVDLLNDKR